MRLSTDRKGSIAEIAIASAAIDLGIDVYKPLNDGTRCDLIFDVGTGLVRVQCNGLPGTARYLSSAVLETEEPATAC